MQYAVEKSICPGHNNFIYLFYTTYVNSKVSHVCTKFIQPKVFLNDSLGSNVWYLARGEHNMILGVIQLLFYLFTSLFTYK